MSIKNQKDDNYMNESMDMRRFFLCLLKKAWIIVVVTVLCASLGAVIYNLYYEITDGKPKYQKCTDFYITFNEPIIQTAWIITMHIHGISLSRMTG